MILANHWLAITARCSFSANQTADQSKITRSIAITFSTQLQYRQQLSEHAKSIITENSPILLNTERYLGYDAGVAVTTA